VLSSAKIGRSSWRYYSRTVAGGACEYYAEQGDAPGRWHGSGLGQLGLTAGARVEERELEALFGRALSPTTGAALGSAWRADAVTGFDLTFSAPKSVSTLWALDDAGTMAAIDAAHGAAVRAALGFLEAHASLSRRGRDGIEQIGTAGFTAALFDHRTSRTGDPQLHTHALVVNKVRCDDGAWRTLDGHEIYHHKKAAGVVYQAALRAELTGRLPVVFGAVSEHGQAEIKGVPEELMAVWSSRTSAVMADAVPTIADAESALGRPVSARERARIIKTAVLTTRPAKDAPVSVGDRRARWAVQAAGLGFAADSVTDSVAAAHRATSPVRPVPGWEQAVVTDAVTDVGRRKAMWSRADLTTSIAARVSVAGVTGPMTAAGTVALVEVLTDTALTRVEVSGAVALGTDRSGVTARASDERFASRELVHAEARIVERAVAEGFRRPDRLPREFLAALYQGPYAALSADQRAAVVRLVASRDLITVMTAPAGAGKTTTLGVAVAAWHSMGMEVTALAPSARAASELSDATGAPGQTVARWLLTHDHLDDPERARHRFLPPREVVIVDEASMLSTADLDRLTARAVNTGSPLVLVGDPAQIGAVNAPGGMFEHLTHTLGAQVIELTELHRFTHPWEAAATLRLRAGDPTVLDVYAEHGRVHPEASSEDAADTVFDRWRTATDHGADALMLARAWTDVNALNARARAVAVATGQVTGPDLMRVATRSASTRGQVEDRTWRAGDVLIAKKNTTRIAIGTETLRNGDRFRVLAANDSGGLVVTDLRGRGTTTLPTGYLAAHAEYGWAATIDGAQGATTDIGIVLARSGLDREHLYVAMTRGRLENHVHTTPELATGDAGPHHHPPTPTGTTATAWPDRRQGFGQAPGRGPATPAGP
jgi:conjugative relaxase-like TrwC/TraI family protein